MLEGSRHDKPKIGRRPVIELVWERKPDRRALRRLNECLRGLDHDAPELTENGMLEVWRKPLMHFSVFTAMLHALGWPCRWRAIPDHEELCDAVQRDAEEHGGEVDYETLWQKTLDVLPWEPSNSERLRTVSPIEARMLRGFSRTTDALLPSGSAGKKRGARRQRGGSHGRG